MLCPTCTKRTAAYNAARYKGLVKRPSKDYCLTCREGLREARKVWRRAYVDRHREKVNQAQRDYRRRMKKAV